MGIGNVSLVAEEGDRCEWMAGQVDVAAAALAVFKLLIVVVAAEAGVHRWYGLLQLSARGKRQMADPALLILFEMLRVVDDEVRLVDDVRAGLVRAGVAHPALAFVLLFLVALQALG